MEPASNLKVEDRIKRWRFLLFAVGFLMLGVGATAIGATFDPSFPTMKMFGLLLLIGGVVQLASSYLDQTRRASQLHMLVGIVHVVIGGLMIEHPAEAAAGLTLVIAAGFLVAGVYRISVALTQDFPSRYWVLINGIVTLLLGIMIWQRWPTSGLLVIGIFVGIELISNGLAWIGLAMLTKPVDAEVKAKGSMGA